MINTLAEINQYFRNMGTIHPDIKDVVIGDAEQILSVDRSKLNYYVLWIETPRITFRMVDHLQFAANINLIVLANVAPDRWEKQQYAMNQTLLIVQDLLTKLFEDQSAGFITLDHVAIPIDPVLGYGHDHDFGWRAQVSLQCMVPPCTDGVSFPLDNQPAQFASFDWNNGNDGDFDSLIITNTSNVDDVVTTAWTYQIDDGAVQTGIPPVMSGAGNYILITLTLTTAATTRVASAFFSSAQNKGESVPYIIDKTFAI